MRIQKNICLFLFLSSLGGMLAWLWRMPNLVGRHIPINGKTMCIFDHVVTVPVSTPTPRLTLHHFPAVMKSICFAFQDFSSSSRHHQFHPLSDQERDITYLDMEKKKEKNNFCSCLHQEPASGKGGEVQTTRTTKTSRVAFRGAQFRRSATCSVYTRDVQSSSALVGALTSRCSAGICRRSGSAGGGRRSRKNRECACKWISERKPALC